jgi:hypothetical protein
MNAHKTYIVRWYIEFEVEAKNKSEARNISEAMLAEEFNTTRFGYTEIFNYYAKELKK